MFYNFIGDFQKPHIGLHCFPLEFFIFLLVFYLCSTCVHLCSTCVHLCSFVFTCVPTRVVFQTRSVSGGM